MDVLIHTKCGSSKIMYKQLTLQKFKMCFYGSHNFRIINLKLIFRKNNM